MCAFLALLVSSCAHAQARAPIDVPSLDVPPPPPRSVEPEPAPVPATPTPQADEPSHPSPRPPVRREPARPESSKPEAPKPEPSEPAKPEETAKPPATLQTTPTQAEGQLEKTIRSTLGQAGADLARVDIHRLNADARTQYDTAQRFIAQAEDAVRARNLVFAKSLADKAAALAAQLAGK